MAVEIDMEHAKLFWSGRSQAVRLPKAFRFEGEEVRIRRLGAAVILEPVAVDWAWLNDVVGPVDADFAAAAEEAPAEQARPGLDVFE
jgi:antitoxin VapB